MKPIRCYYGGRIAKILSLVLGYTGPNSVKYQIRKLIQSSFRYQVGPRIISILGPDEITHPIDDNTPPEKETKYSILWREPYSTCVFRIDVLANGQMIGDTGGYFTAKLEINNTNDIKGVLF